MSAETQILFCKPATVSEPDKAALREAGIITVEVESLDDVKLVRAGFEIPHGTLLAAAATAVMASPTGSSRFGAEVAKAILALPSQPPKGGA